MPRASVGSSHDVAGSPSGSSSTKTIGRTNPWFFTTSGLPGMHWVVCDSGRIYFYVLGPMVGIGWCCAKSMNGLPSGGQNL